MSNNGDESGDGDQTTSSTKTRWEGLSTFVSVVIVVAYTVIFGYVTHTAGAWPEGPAGVTFRLGFILVVLYVVGPTAVESYKRLRGGGGGGQ